MILDHSVKRALGDSFKLLTGHIYSPENKLLYHRKFPNVLILQRKDNVLKCYNMDGDKKPRAIENLQVGNGAAFNHETFFDNDADELPNIQGTEPLSIQGQALFHFEDGSFIQDQASCEMSAAATYLLAGAGSSNAGRGASGARVEEQGRFLSRLEFRGNSDTLV
jgi:hypothetical protein